MRFIGFAIFTLFITGTVSATLPRLAVVSIDFDDFAPDSVILGKVMDVFTESGRFQVVDLGDDSFLDTSPDSLLSSLRILASERGIDVFLAMEILYPE
ncbi:MAG: hypothetical protein KAT09_00730, partial [Candidatus Aegiribacteria sp.]|nr:hypothetical protein [Candidatus Aegiribacteria sp.]